jgi:2-keto-4-pentenoate hydratase/2-oxohepta-3-ene-1,7-dioic acid hydratase in catechol pathway
MRLFAFRDEAGEPLVGLIDGDELAVNEDWLDDLSSAALDDLGGFLEALAVAARIGRRFPMAAVLPAPAVPSPRKIVCVGLNYGAHVSEGGRATPELPLLFSKFANAVVGDGDAVVRPEGTRALDLEVELGVVIGRRARRVAAEDAMAHVAGYVVVNDVSARDWQGVKAALPEGKKGDGQWLRAKGSDTFLPVGPEFVTPDEVDPAAGLRIRSWRIPGSGPDAGTPVLMQDGTTADMLHSVPELIAWISKHVTLEPGDLIATGTPAGVGVFRDPPVFLEPGDRIRCEIEGIGAVENAIVDWTEDPRPA